LRGRALLAEGETLISGAEAASVSLPELYSLLHELRRRGVDFRLLDGQWRMQISSGRPMIASTRSSWLAFMGSGEETVGEALATLLNRSFIDLDRLIEARANETNADLIRP
jgi:hypothetical protein